MARPVKIQKVGALRVIALDANRSVAIMWNGSMFQWYWRRQEAGKLTVTNVNVNPDTLKAMIKLGQAAWKELK